MSTAQSLYMMDEGNLLATCVQFCITIRGDDGWWGFLFSLLCHAAASCLILPFFPAFKPFNPYTPNHHHQHHHRPQYRAEARPIYPPQSSLKLLLPPPPAAYIKMIISSGQKYHAAIPNWLTFAETAKINGIIRVLCECFGRIINFFGAKWKSNISVVFGKEHLGHTIVLANNV